MTFEISYEAEEPLDLPYEEIITKVIEAALDQEACPYEAEVSVTLTDADEVQRINREFRGIDLHYRCAVFPHGGVSGSARTLISWRMTTVMDCFNPETGELLLGDIILNVARVIGAGERIRAFAAPGAGIFNRAQHAPSYGL